MNLKLQKSLAASALLLLVVTTAASVTAIAQTDSSQGGQKQRGPGGPPPQEAFDACESLVVNDSCTVATPEGTLNGSCQVARRGDKLLCVPAR